MAKTVTPSVTETTTPGQIDKAVANYRAMLEKHAGEFQAEAVQTVLGMKGLAGEMFGLFRKRIETISNMIIRHVTTDGRTGEQFIAALTAANYNLGDYGKQLLRSDKFIPTNGKTYKLVVIKGDEFEDNDRITSKIRAQAAQRGYLVPSVEVAPLLRELVSDEELEQMGLYALIVMHEPITDSDGSPDVLGVDRNGGGRWLSACHGSAGSRWYREDGFVFLVPQD